MKKMILCAAVSMLAACGDMPAEETAEVPAGPPVEVKAADLQKKFGENEVAEKAELAGKSLKVTGKIEAIELNFMDKPVVRLRGADEFSSVHLSFDEPSQAKTSALKKGEEFTATCTEIGEVIGSPMLENCSF